MALAGILVSAAGAGLGSWLGSEFTGNTGPTGPYLPSAQHPGYQLASEDIQTGADEANSNLNQGYAAANQTLAGANTGYGTALNAYFQLLGLPAPNSGGNQQGLVSPTVTQPTAAQTSAYQQQSAQYNAQVAAIQKAWQAPPGANQQAYAAAANQQIAALGAAPVAPTATTTYGSPNQNSINSILSNTPGYQFTVQQGTAQLAQDQASMGLLNSGGTQQQLAGLISGYASQNYNNVVSQYANAAGGLSYAPQAISSNQVNQGIGLANVAQNAAQGLSSIQMQQEGINQPFQLAALQNAGNAQLANTAAGIASQTNAANTATGAAISAGNTNATSSGALGISPAAYNGMSGLGSGFGFGAGQSNAIGTINGVQT